MLAWVVQKQPHGIADKACGGFMSCVQKKDTVLDQFLLREPAPVMLAKDQAFQASLQTHSMFMFDNADALMKALDVSTPLKRVTTDRV